ncbi:hypothetical protein LTR85_003324 [Meristemomyces frigidus]|nr:hypothetical protein LTR85_003324 [Meristemomyces frigidus]
MSIYLDGEATGSLLLRASISDQVGSPLPYSQGSSTGNHTLEVEYFLNGNVSLLVDSGTVTISGGQIEVLFELAPIPVTLSPQKVTAIATLRGSNAIYYPSTQLSKLPRRTDNGSVTRVDHLYGGLAVRKPRDTQWQAFFPYTYYVQWTLYWNTSVTTLNEFASMGYNVIDIVPTGDLGDTPYPWAEFEPYLDRADELGLYLQFDVRWDYSNLTLMTALVSHYSTHPSILLWYTGDEPDGKSDPLNSTRIAYDTIRSIDPYHPVSLALNCADFYYSDYASGAEIILSDVYPISTNTSWSTVYETPCNATYGCCGCDDCHESFEDNSDRLDNFARFDDLLGWQKTHWRAPQAFGNETLWTRFPTAAEEVVMTMLSINHAAKGIVMWDFPTSADILNVTCRLATVLTSKTVADFFIGGPLTSSLAVSGADKIDASVWVTANSVLLSVVNLNYGDTNQTVTVQLPAGLRVSGVAELMWGDVVWNKTATRGGGSVRTSGLRGLEVSLVALDRS